MALPTSNNLNGLNYKYKGKPFNEGASSPAVNTDSLNYKLRGLPFNGNPYPSAAVFARAPYMTGVLSIKA